MPVLTDCEAPADHLGLGFLSGRLAAIPFRSHLPVQAAFTKTTQPPRPRVGLSLARAAELHGTTVT
jgi:hypothetical protein